MCVAGFGISVRGGSPPGPGSACAWQELRRRGLPLGARADWDAVPDLHDFTVVLREVFDVFHRLAGSAAARVAAPHVPRTRAHASRALTSPSDTSANWR